MKHKKHKSQHLTNADYPATTSPPSNITPTPHPHPSRTTTPKKTSRFHNHHHRGAAPPSYHNPSKPHTEPPSIKTSRCQRAYACMNMQTRCPVWADRVLPRYRLSTGSREGKEPQDKDFQRKEPQDKEFPRQVLRKTHDIHSAHPFFMILSALYLSSSILALAYSQPTRLSRDTKRTAEKGEKEEDAMTGFLCTSDDEPLRRVHDL